MKSIDLGLSVDWGETNWGADNPHEYGMYLSWKEIVDFDPCTKQQGEGWRLPTKEEFEELINKCDVLRTELNDVPGFCFTSKGDLNKLFLPAGGCKSFDEPAERYKEGKNLYYWSSSPYVEEDIYGKPEIRTAYALESNGNVKCKPGEYRFSTRYTIRLVKDKEKKS